MRMFVIAIKRRTPLLLARNNGALLTLKQPPPHFACRGCIGRTRILLQDLVEIQHIARKVSSCDAQHEVAMVFLPHLRLLHLQTLKNFPTSHKLARPSN